MQDLRWREGEREDGDVVFLTEGLRGVSDIFGGLGCDSTSALEAKEFTGRIASLNHAVGDEQQGFAGAEVKALDRKGDTRERAEGKSAI
jgi:hypothetical protein